MTATAVDVVGSIIAACARLERRDDVAVLEEYRGDLNEIDTMIWSIVDGIEDTEYFG